MNTIPHKQRRQLVCRLRDSVLDFDIQVDDARQDINAATARLRAAVRARDEVAAMLAKLIARQEFPAA